MFLVTMGRNGCIWHYGHEHRVAHLIPCAVDLKSREAEQRALAAAEGEKLVVPVKAWLYPHRPKEAAERTVWPCNQSVLETVHQEAVSIVQQTVGLPAEIMSTRS